MIKHKTFAIDTKAVDAEAGIYEGMISTESIDRDEDIVMGAGAQLSNYMKNPVVLFGHNYREPGAVVGRALEVTPIPGSGVKARWQFADESVSENAALVRRLWEGGYLNAISIGFQPQKWSKRVDDEGEELDFEFVFEEWELLEFSIVPVPSNQDALRLAVKGLDVEELRTRMIDDKLFPLIEIIDDDKPSDEEPNTTEESDQPNPEPDERPTESRTRHR
jgi:HK97 family phage prohead protease